MPMIFPVNQLKKVGSCLRLISSHNPFKQAHLDLDEASVSTAYQLIDLMKRSVLYESENIVACYKPYGVSTMGPNEVVAEEKDDFERHMRKLSDEKVCLNAILPELAEELHCKQLLLGKSLPRYVSGVVVFAKTLKSRQRIQSSIGFYQSNQTPYIFSRVITVGTPEPKNGVNVYASTKVPVGDSKQFVLTAKPTQNQIHQGVVVRGVVQHSTLDVNGDCSLVELKTTAMKWAIPRLALVHLGAPIIGDVFQQRIAKILGKSVAVDPSKASAKNQFISVDIMRKLEISVAEYFNLPMCFHVFAMKLRNVDGPNSEIIIGCPTPPHFQRFLDALQLKEPQVVE